MLSRDFLLLALCDRVVSRVQEEANSCSTLYMSPAPEDLLFVAHPVNPILSVHGGGRSGDSVFGDGVLADGTERLSWRIGGSGPGEFGYPVVNYLLAGSCGPRASPWTCRVEAVLQSGWHTHLRSLGRSGGLLRSFWLKAEDRQSFPFDGPRVPLQPQNGSISPRYAFSISWLCPSISFSFSKSPWGCRPKSSLLL